jgi:hypothetical protein
VLQRFGVHIDDAANGVFLPKNGQVPNPTGAMTHTKLHGEFREEYYAAVNNLLSRAKSRDQVIQTLGHIRDRLLAGGLP